MGKKDPKGRDCHNPPTSKRSRTVLRRHLVEGAILYKNTKLRREKKKRGSIV